MKPLDTTAIAPKLGIGAYPKDAAALREAGWQALVLCAEELQDHAEAFPGIIVVHCPFDDSHKPTKREEIERAMATAGSVARLVRAGFETLVTCHHGHNRSGLVTALALWLLYPELSGGEAMRRVQAKRAKALNRSEFRFFLESLPARRGGTTASVGAVYWRLLDRFDNRPTLGAERRPYPHLS